ncbi:MAG: VCBS repeat-containing protein [Bacteroidia bacterium]|nr:VCBS repeat-containing protein [Bacteroidia bacterium]
MKKTLLSFICIINLGLFQNAKAQLSFSAAINYSVGTNPNSLTSADFNGDGKTDLAVANSTSNDLSILLGSGTGTFATAGNYTLGTNPKSIISADFNNDGKIDLASANQGSNDVSVLLGSGTGTFLAAVSYSAGTGAKAITSADFNSDGNIDLAIANNTSGNVSVLFGSGTGTFAAPVNYTAGSGPWAISIADFNNDSNVDLVALNSSGNNVSVLLGSGTGTFATAVNYAVSTNPRGLTTADFNGDGKVDLATANLTLNDVSILLGNGNGTFASVVNYAAGGTFPVSVTSADFDIDGFLDLATTNSTTGNVSILRGSGIGTFSAGGTYTAGGNPFLAKADDFNGDGKTDLAVANQSSNNVSILINTSIPLVSNANFLISNPKCVNGSITFTDKSTYFPTNWVWSFPGGSPSSSSSQNPIVTYSAAGTYSAVLTASNGIGAGTSLTQTFVVNANPIATASNTGTLTCTTTTLALNGGSAGLTYLWSGSGIIGSTTTQNTSVNTGGIYTLLVTNTITGCSNTATTIVSQNTTPPTANATNSGTLTCSTVTVGLFGTGGGSYNWSGPGIISGSITPNPIVNLPGCYNLTVTAANGCTAGVITCVSQNTISPTVTGGVSGTLTCATSTVNAFSTTTVTPVSYNWSGTGIVTGTGTGTITVVQPGIFNYTVTNSTNGCTSTGTRIVPQNTLSPSGTNAGMDQTITCGAPTLTLTGSVSSPTNALYSWSGGVCGSPTSSVTAVCAGGVYTLTTTDPINGCTDSDIIQINSNVAVPAVTLSSNSATITCNTLTVSVSASTSASPVSYSWSPSSGIVGGSGSTNTAYFNAPGSYSLVVTDLINGCSTNISSNVVNVLQNIFIPSITISASPSIICSGNSSTLTAFAGSDTDYNWLPGSLNGATQTVTPITSTLYTVVATNTITGCANSETITLTVNTTPTLSIAGNTTICNGSTSTLTGSGAISYTWNSGANTTTISVTPSITTTYTLIGDNGNGCSSSLPITVSIIPNKAINGIITSTTGATNGDVTLYKYTVGLSHWDSVTTVPFTSSYSFANIDSGLYVIRAIPTATNIQVTYADSAISWQGATIITHGCTNNTAQNIKLITLENFIIGPGVLTGTIVEAFGYVPRMSDENKSLFPGSPIGGIVVKGGKNPGGQMFVQTITDAAGQYTLTGLPLNTGNESYFVFVDIPGLDTNGTYHVVIASGSTQYNGLNFNADAMYINPTGSNTSIITENSLLDNSIYVFPNPAKEVVNIKYELTESADVSIELFNVIGEKIMQVSQPSLQNKNKYQHSINMENINSGIYFIKIKVNSSEKVIKLIKTQ